MNRPITYGLLMCAMLWAGQVVTAQCDKDQLSDAKRDFEQGKFQEVIDALTICLPERTAGQPHYKGVQREEALSLLAKSHIQLDQLEEAKAAVQRLVNAYENYSFGAEDPLVFKYLVNQAKEGGDTETILSVSKTKEDIRKAPATVMVLTSKEIRDRGYTNLESVFHDLPGFDISSAKGLSYSSIYMRGNRSEFSDKMLFLVDGVEENDLTNSNAWISRQYSISNIERIEIIYGPTSTMYGSNAYSGVVNIITKGMSKLDDGELKLDADVKTGTWNTTYADVNARYRFNKDISLSLTGRYFSSDEMDFSTFDYGNDQQYNVWDYELQDQAWYYERINDSMHAQSFRQSDSTLLNALNNQGFLQFANHTRDWLVGAKVSLFKDVQVGFQSWRRQEGKLGWYTDNHAASLLGGENAALWIPQNSFIYVRYDKDIPDSKWSMNIFARYKYHKLDNGTSWFTINTYAKKISEEYEGTALDSADVGSSYGGDMTHIYRSSQGKQLRSEARLIYNGEQFKLVSGLDYRNSAIQGPYLNETRNYDPFGTTPIDLDSINPSQNGVLSSGDAGSVASVIVSSWDLGAYSQASYSFSDKFQGVLGGRLDVNRIRDNQGYGAVFNYRTALVYVEKSFVIKALLASAFKDASTYNKYATIPVIRQIPAPNLRPESTQNLELSGAWKHKNFKIDLASFVSTYDETVITSEQADSTVDTTGAVTYYSGFINSGGLLIKGLQGNVSWFLKDKRGIQKVRLMANFSLINSRQLNELWKPNVFQFRNFFGSAKDTLNPVADIANFRFNFIANFKLVKGLNLNLRYNYVGKKHGVLDSSHVNAIALSGFTKGQIPSYHVLNASLRYALPIKKIKNALSIEFRVNNLLDNHYYHPGIRLQDGGRYAQLIPQNTRNFLVGLEYHF